MASKEDFAQQMRTKAGQFAQVAADFVELHAAYFDRGYNVGGSDPITDEDVIGQEITANDLVTGITAAAQLGNYMSAAAVIPGDYSATWNRLRRIGDL